MQISTITIFFARRALPCTCLAFAVHVAMAQSSPPDAGKVTRELMHPELSLPKSRPPSLRIEQPSPEMSADAGGAVRLVGVSFSGNLALTNNELEAVVADEINKMLDLPGLQAVAQRVTQYYRERGYLLARAYLPAQDMTDGRLEIAILEGHYGAIELKNTSGIADGALLSRLRALRMGAPVEAASLGRGLLLLGDIPGIEVKSTLRPGSTPGTSDLVVDVEPGRRLAGSAELDNHGSRYTGEFRLGGGVEINNPLELGDQLSLRALTSDEGLWLGRVAYQVPLGGDGLRAGAAHSDMRYKLGKEFASLRTHGSSLTDSLFAQYPIARSRGFNLNGQAQWDRKRLEDRVDSTATITPKQLDAMTLSLTGDFQDGWGGASSFSIALGNGRLRLDSAAALGVDRVTAKSAGAYTKLNANLLRMQRVTDDLGLLMSLQAQWAGGNLDSAEKMGLGGNQGVRAYSSGEASGDDGWMANFELRQRLDANWSAGGFVDHGEVRINHRPWATGDNTRSLAAYGLAANWSDGAEWTFKGVLAWRGNQRPSADVDRTPRVWLQLARRF